MATEPGLIDTTERIAGLLAEQGIKAIVIGAETPPPTASASVRFAASID